MKKTSFSIFLLIFLLFSSPSFADVYGQSLEAPNLKQRIDQGGVVFILSIDGGGIRGIIPIHLIRYLEQKTNKMSADLFQIIAGTSSGALIAAGLTIPTTEDRPKFSADVLLTLYNINGPKLFYSPWWHRIITLNGLIGTKYLPTYKNKLIRQITGNLKLSQLRSEVLIPCLSLRSCTPHFFKTWKARENPAYDYHMADILTGTTSPLTIFPPRDIDNIIGDDHDVIMDGGFFCNNSALNAYLSARLLYPKKKIIIVSLGVGLHSPCLFPETVEYVGKHWGIVQAAYTILGLSLTGTSENTDLELTEIFHQESSPLLGYFRFNIHIDQEYQGLFDGSKENIAVLNHYGREIVSKNKKTLDHLAQLLTQFSQSLLTHQACDQ